MSDQTEERPFAGRTALVTGSGQNIGRAIALAFARGGANVVINGHRNQEAIDRVAAEIEAFGVRSLAVLADVGDPAAVQAMVDKAADVFDGVDIAISNVSVRLHTKFLDISLEEWHRIINSNLSASFYLARAVLPSMQAKKWGRIIHISGKDGFAVIPNRAHNVTCKAGVLVLLQLFLESLAGYRWRHEDAATGTTDTAR
jgi:3-oxoacyl-[acyl-carrier protein] reductase